VSERQLYRMRAPSSGREVVIEAVPDEVYVDRVTGETLEVVAKLLPLAPSESQLPWAVENLRFCNWCDQLAQKDLNDCPHCGPPDGRARLDPPCAALRWPPACCSPFPRAPGSPRAAAAAVATRRSPHLS